MRGLVSIHILGVLSTHSLLGSIWLKKGVCNLIGAISWGYKHHSSSSTNLHFSKSSEVQRVVICPCISSVKLRLLWKENNHSNVFVFCHVVWLQTCRKCSSIHVMMLLIGICYYGIKISNLAHLWKRKNCFSLSRSSQPSKK